MTRGIARREHTPFGRCIVYGAVYSLIVMCGCYSVRAAEYREKEVRRIRFPSAYDVRTHKTRHLDTFTMRFKARFRYPSTDVLGFYDGALERVGWVSFAEPDYRHADRTWDCFRDLTQPGDPMVHRLSAKWTNHDKTRMAVLIISYYSYSRPPKAVDCGSPDDDVQNVVVQFMPFTPLRSRSDG